MVLFGRASTNFLNKFGASLTPLSQQCSHDYKQILLKQATTIMVHDNAIPTPRYVHVATVRSELARRDLRQSLTREGPANPSSPPPSRHSSGTMP